MILNFTQFINEAKNDILNNPNFIKWFGNSKVVDKNGNPLIVYHGTSNDFNEFNYDKIQTTRRPGFYFTENKELANNYNKNNRDGKIIEAYVSIKNPLNSDETKKIDITKDNLSKIFKLINIDEDVNKVYDNEDSDIDILSYMIKKTNVNVALNAIYKVTGKDGMIINSGYGKTYIAFNPNQIKSIDNNGNFSLSSNNINEAKYNILNNPNFIKWFGDSKIVDGSGNPLVIYHGIRSGKYFSEFKTKGDKGYKRSDYSQSIEGIYFSDNKSLVEKKYARENGKILEVYLRMVKPLDLGNNDAMYFDGRIVNYGQIVSSNFKKQIKGEIPDPEPEIIGFGKN